MTIAQAGRMCKRMPKTIREAIDYEGRGSMGMEDADQFGEEEMMHDEPKKSGADFGEGGMDVMEFVDDIRKKSLKGMAQLADNPDDERYQLLKKIWQICDKKPEQQTAFSNPNARPEQQKGRMM